MNPMKIPLSSLLLMMFSASLRITQFLYLTDVSPSRPAARHIIVDPQRMKERLGVIVRAKEG
jgi:hypothetical protein